jgi:chemotaxis protein methyltransferase CheR
MATFARLNLVDESALAGMRNGAFDLILCRNVLMYFTPAQAAKVVGTLHGALHEDGWLAVAPCEASQTLFERFRPAHCGGAIFYRKGRASSERAASKAVATSPAAAVPQARATHPARMHPPLAARRRTPAPATPPRTAGPASAGTTEAALPAQAMAARARALADQRRMDEALAWCDRWVAAAKLDPAAHYLRGMILAEKGEVAEACTALERSLYLAPGGAMASLALANLERARGRGGHAMRHYRNILASLEGLPPEGGIEHAEGVSVRQLAALVRDLMAVGEHA